MLRHFCTSVFAFCSFAAPANADWQFTKWGMAPEQVIAASNGAAAMLPESGNYDLTAMVKMPFESGDLAFAATFLFDRSRHLRMVRLEQTKGSGEVAYEALSAKYGTPEKGRNDAAPDILDRFWIVGSDDVEFVYLAGTYRCTVIYQPHDSASQPQQVRNGQRL